jgi:hypothetical protein
MTYAIAAILLVCLVALVTIPLRREQEDPAAAKAAFDREELRAELAELEARKAARYREIRDAEGDRAAGKLDDADFDRLDGELRAEAADVLKEIDRVRSQLGLNAKSG